MAKRPQNAIVSKAGQTMDLAGPVSDRVQIQNIVLAESSARRHPDCADPPANLAMRVAVTTDYKESEFLIQVRPTFTLVGRDTAENTEEKLHIEALFVLQYKVPSFDGLSKANIDAFGELNGVFNVWPYWREFVQNMTVRMGLPPLTVPVYRPLALTPSKRPRRKTVVPHRKRVR